MNYLCPICALPGTEVGAWTSDQTITKRKWACDPCECTWGYTHAKPKTVTITAADFDAAVERTQKERMAQNVFEGDRQGTMRILKKELGLE